MADLDFKHRVQEIPQGRALPKSYERSVSTEINYPPDIQSAVNRYAENTNWMSSVGSEVATRASNAIAAKLGSELGKNPQGELGPSFTEFDKNFQQSYNTQAQSTLGLQAQKLITQSNLELAALPKLDPGAIEQAQSQVYAGLQHIYSLAPNAIRPQMESHYGSVMINQMQQLTSRMIREQKDDRLNTLNLSSKLNAQNAHSLALNGIDVDKNGDSKAGLQVVFSTINATNAAVNNKDITPVDAKVQVDTAYKSYLSGKYTRLALEAERQGKLPEFLRLLADKRPSDLKDEYYPAVLNNVVMYMNQQQALRNQDQQLKMLQFAVKVSEDPDNITGTEFVQLQSQLNPLQAQKVKLELVKALQKKKTESTDAQLTIQNWGDANTLARTPDTIKNKAFDQLVNAIVSNSNNPGKIPVTREMAEVQVAASAGAPVPVFTKSIQYKLSSGNPAFMEEAAQQIHALYSMGAGHALSGLNSKDKAAFGAYEALRGSLQPTDAARETINNIYNQDPVMFEANQTKWKNYISTQSRGVPQADFALGKFGFKKSNFLTPTMAQIYGTDMLEKYALYYQILGGDEVTAQRVTQRYVDENYGYTGINGGSNVTLHPVEKLLGYESSDVIPIIQQDIINQLDKHFSPSKEAFLKGESNEYWETEKLTGKTHGIFSTTYDPIKVKRITKIGEQMKSQEFDVVVQGNAFDNWDIAINSESGLRNLYQIAPYLGVINYLPNKRWIDDQYLGNYHEFPYEKYQNTLAPLLTPGGSNG